MGDFGKDPLKYREWPAKARSLFHSTGPKSTVVRLDWINIRGEDRTIADAFKAAADQSVEYLLGRQTRRRHDKYFFPIAYLYRHALELQLKILLTRTGYDPTEEEDDLRHSHSLLKIWREFRSRFEPALPAHEGYDLDISEKIIQQFHQLDKSGMELRYGRSKGGREFLSTAPDQIDLTAFRETFDHLWFWLRANENGIELYMGGPDW